MPGASTDHTVVVLGSFAPSLVQFRGPLIAELVRKGYRVVAMAPDMAGDVREKLRMIGAECREVPIVNTSLNPVAALGSHRALVKALREIAPEALISYTIKPVTIGSLAAHRARVPKIVALVTGLGFAFTEGGGLKRRLSRFVAMFLYRRAFERCSAILFQNPDDLSDFRRLGLLPSDRQIAVVNGSGIDLDHFKPVPLPGRPIFLMISRLLGDKGVREYGAAAVALKRAYPEARFQLVGYFDGSPDEIGKGELEEMRRGGVEFLGRMDDVRPAIAEASIYVLPSYREGTPRSVLEAMAMGRPIVTTDAPGCRETVVAGVNGYLVPPRQTQALTDAIRRFIEAPESITAMGRESRLMAERKYDVHEVNRSILKAADL